MNDEWNATGGKLPVGNPSFVIFTLPREQD